jgi:hypothetical protein
MDCTKVEKVLKREPFEFWRGLPVGSLSYYPELTSCVIYNSATAHFPLCHSRPTLTVAKAACHSDNPPEKAQSNTHLFSPLWLDTVHNKIPRYSKLLHSISVMSIDYRYYIVSCLPHSTAMGLK